MKTNISIKLCGIKQANIAVKAISLGANYIGLVFHKASKRYVNMALAAYIAEATITAGGIPVAVFVDHNAADMQTILDTTGITIMQLQGDNANASLHLLASHYIRIYAQAVDTKGNVMPDIAGGLHYCDPNRDYLLFDNLLAGTGETLPWDTLSPSTSFRYGLAGGLNPDNIATAILKMKPDFVDVSTGIENISGEKDLELIAAFIQKARGTDHANS